MRGKSWSWVLPLALWLAGCATSSPTARGPAAFALGGGRPLLASAEVAGWSGLAASGEESEGEGPPLGVVTARQRESEGLRATAEMWGVLAQFDEVGTEVEFTFWASHGTVTMTSWRHSAGGGVHGEEVDARGFAQGLRALAVFVGDEPHALHLVHRREQRAWVMHAVRVSTESPPPEARMLPVDVPGVPAGAFAGLEREARTRWLQVLQAPREGAASVALRVDFEDGRYVGSGLVRSTAKGSEARVGAPPGFETQLASALVPFIQGLGSRSVRMLLEAARAPGDFSPRWRVTSVETLRPVRDEATEPWTTVTEHRLLHEEIIRRWREEVRDTAVFAAAFTTEQLALFVVGGWAARGVGAALELGAGAVARVLGRGGPAAAEWLESLLVRMPKPERDALARLWAKVETEGFKALSETQKAELRAAFQRLEQKSLQPIAMLDNDRVRTLARNRFWTDLERVNPELAARLRIGGHRFPIHHRFPLEFGQFDPELDINALSNLVAVAPEVHHSIGRAWTAFRPRRGGMTLAEIHEVMAIVDRNYGRWYNTVYEAQQAQLVLAESAAKSELAALLARMEGR